MKIIGAKFVDEEEKSSQERQQNLEDKHKEENELAQKGSAGSEEPKGDEIKLEDETVLNYIKTKYEKEINSIEDLFKEKVVEKVVEPELPEPVKKFMDFQKETGRGFGDFLKYQRDIDSLPDEEKLVEYYLDTNEGFDKEDAKTYIEMNFGFDEDMDDESEIKKKKLKMKQELGKAKKHLQEKSEKYKAPTESVGADFTKTEEYQQYQQFLQQSQSQNEVVAKRAKIFNEGTNQLFSEEFKGFDFEVEEGQKLTFNPASAQELKKAQSDYKNFISKFVDEEGVMTDTAGYHRAMAAAMNADKFAKFFYEQGKAAAADGLTKDLKNINMGSKKTPQKQVKGGLQVKFVNPESNGNRLQVTPPKGFKFSN